jgi:hypothetical protein
MVDKILEIRDLIYEAFDRLKDTKRHFHSATVSRCV